MTNIIDCKDWGKFGASSYEPMCPYKRFLLNHKCCESTFFTNEKISYITKKFVQVDVDEVCSVCGKFKRKKRVNYRGDII